MQMMFAKIVKELERLKNPEKARGLSRFFKTGKGEYGEGDLFWGITVPQQREVAKKFYKEVTLLEIEKLLHSQVHEHRLTALIMLVMKYKMEQKQIFKLYLRNTKRINNWDLVDLSAPNIVGEYIFHHGGGSSRFDREARRVDPPKLLPSAGDGADYKPAPTEIIYKLAKSSLIWERRISIISTFAFIRHNQYAPTIKISEILLHDKHDLIHKAVGWMLREVGKRDKKVLIEFLNKHHEEMPRVMLRYAVEKFEKVEREKYFTKYKLI